MMDIRPLTGSLGAEIIGADIKDDQKFEAIYQAFVDILSLRSADRILRPRIIWPLHADLEPSM
jgi:hypothetical protein